MRGRAWACRWQSLYTDTALVIISSSGIDPELRTAPSFGFSWHIDTARATVVIEILVPVWRASSAAPRGP